MHKHIYIQQYCYDYTNDNPCEHMCELTSKYITNENWYDLSMPMFSSSFQHHYRKDKNLLVNVKKGVLNSAGTKHD